MALTQHAFDVSVTFEHALQPPETIRRVVRAYDQEDAICRGIRRATDARTSKAAVTSTVVLVLPSLGKTANVSGPFPEAGATP